MVKISMESEYDFKEDYCRVCLWNQYLFNSVEDLINNRCFNTDKMSWKSWYYMHCDGEDRLYLSKQQMMW